MPLPDYLLVCRLCVLKGTSQANIFEVNGSHKFSVADVINELLDLNVSPGDGLTDRICCDCLNELARFKRFKSVSHEAKKTLEFIAKQNNNPLPASEYSKPLVVSDDKDNDEIVEIVDLIDDEDSEEGDSGAETIAAPSPLPADITISDDEISIESDDIPVNSNCNVECETSVSVSRASNQASGPSVQQVDQNLSVYNAVASKKFDGEGKCDSGEKVPNNMQDVCGDINSLENYIESYGESEDGNKNDSDIEEVEIDDPLALDLMKGKDSYNLTSSKRPSQHSTSKPANSNQHWVVKDNDAVVNSSSSNVSSSTLYQRARSSRDSSGSADRDVFTCSKCEKIFESDLALKHHIKMNVCLVMDCKNCGKNMYNEVDFSPLEHLKRCTKPQLFTCKFCLKSFSKPVSLRNHLKSHVKKSMKNVVECDKCYLHFNEEKLYKKHREKCGLPKENFSKDSICYFKCGICNMGYRTVKSINRHIKVYSHNSKLTCGKCGKVCLSMPSLRAHIACAHGYLRCTLCSKNFGSPHQLKVHYLVHSLERPFRCTKCKYGYNTKVGLDVHVAKEHK